MNNIKDMYFYIKHYFTGCPEDDLIEIHNGAMEQCTKCKRKNFVWR